MKVFLYIRVACADQLAAADQREELERYAKDKGYEVAAAVAADGISGVHTEGIMNFLLNEAKRQDIGTILTRDTSRISRDTSSFMRFGVEIPGEKTVYRIMKKIGLTHHPKRKPNGITKADREAMKSDDLLKRDFRSDEPLKKCITDITEIKAKDGKLYTSVIFDCFDLSVLGIAMSTNMKAELCVQTLDNAMASYPALHGAIIHSDRGAQYTSGLYRRAITQYGIRQSMNSAGGRCHDNARCESMWARMKTELLYDRYDPEQLTVEQLKSMVWRYFMSYWNNRRICSANGGLPPMVKRSRFYAAQAMAA